MSERLAIDAALARRMVAAQFPAWADLPIRPLPSPGWDHCTFRLGEAMVLRMPSAAEYTSQIHKEWRWLRQLAPHLPLAIPEPLARGKPGDGYPWIWGIYRWIAGEPVVAVRPAEATRLAADLALFLSDLQGIETAGGPPPGVHNFHRGAALEIYDGEVREAIGLLQDRLDVDAASRAWDQALASMWTRPPVWVHGDISAGNLLTREDRLVAVIDFGMLAVGDPACDYAIAWTVFDAEARAAFRQALRVDDATWSRARGWALWKALIVASEQVRTNAAEFDDPWRVVEECLGTFDRSHE